MLKLLSFLGCIILWLSCSVKHKTPQEIYQNGTVENFNDFVRVDTFKVDNDDMVDEYIYKYDTSFHVQKMYSYSYITKKKTFRNLSFLYKGKYEGKVMFYDPDGSTVGTVYFKNGEEVKDADSH